jgi:hypothetical protein
MFLLSVTAGALDVLTIVVGLGQLGLPPSAAGYLAAARGGGGLLGGLWTLRLVAHPRLAAAMATGLLLYGAATASLGLVVVIAMAVLLQVAAGAGYARSEMSGRTLLQRLVPDDVLARVFGVLEGVSQAGQAAGAALAPILVALLGIRGGTLVAGFLLPVAVLIRLSRLRAIDRTAEIPERELSVLRSVDMFAPLSPHHFEGLAARVHDVASPAGTVIIRQGTPGDRLYVIADGEVEVTRDGWPVATLGSGDYVGEISLLRDTPHNATVTATTPVALLELERADFIELMTNELVAREAADLTAEERTPPGPS